MKPKFKKQEEFHKTVPIIRDLNLNPCCEHGKFVYNCTNYICISQKN